MNKLIVNTEFGLYCPQGDFFIDPWRPVEKALITHAHSDHARPGSRHYMAHEDSESVLRLRLGNEISLDTVQYGETRRIDGVRVSLHPAGHILGSAQIRLEYRGEVWVISGDYKLENDRLSEPFEALKCNTFITESTFGLPVYKWGSQEEIYNRINSWWLENRERDKASVLFAYTLGKSQRILLNIDTEAGEIWAHGAIYNIHKALKESGVNLPEIKRGTADNPKKMYRKALILAPPSALNSPWMRRFEPCSTAMASGWMAIRGNKRRRAIDKGFTLSDHADWNALNETIKATQAEMIYVTHGYKEAMVKWLREKGYEASALDTEFTGEADEAETL